MAERWKEVEELDRHFFRGQEPPPLETRMRELGGIRAIVIGGFCEHGAEVHRLLERAVVAKVQRADTERGEDPRGYGARVREKWRQELSIGAWRDFNAYIVARLPYINPSPGAEAILLEQRARADTDWAEKLAAKQREKLRVEGEGLASSARAGRGTAVEDAVSRRLDPMAQKGGVAEAAAAATRAARRVPEQAGTRKGKEETRRQAQERKAMATEEKATRKAAERERKAKEREATRAAKAEAAETRARDREATKRAKAKMRAEARTKAAEAKATARAEAKEAKEAKEAAAKAAKAEAKAAKTTQQAAAKKAKAKARNKQAEAEEARATEQTQVEVAGSSGRGTETGEVHVYTGRARRASRRATGVG